MSVRPALWLLGNIAGATASFFVVGLLFEHVLHWSQSSPLEGRLLEALLFGVFFILLPKVLRRITGIFRSS